MLTSLSATDARMETTTLSRYQLSDDHNVPALVETAAGRVVAFWGGHGKAPVQYRVSGPQGAISSMSAVRRLKGSGMEDVTTTYVQTFRMRGVSNQYHLLTRRHSDQNWVLTTSKDLVTWTKPLQLFKNSDTVDSTWPYLEAAS
ncbi:BNR-4 repeat-containing protein, partial [Janibacter terrae]|uniref:BNR-4 repeat-containing protein n=1 Tax=Janibacter terrae TaxID=103817 RepID=UPI000B333922